MRRAFLRSPVDFRRISSHFKRERFHPVLGKKRPHRGVDYAAATGTPIKAAGDGKVIWRGTKGGYGRTVIIQHGGNITTLYAHMSRYRKGVTNGSRVKQGQIIGYVGASGLATGPHLHYEFRINGSHKNPLTVALPQAGSVPASEMSAFAAEADERMAMLDRRATTRLALNGARP
jgi:murein DD-endopeptidase MepM/ murein hydrolase activator NlpD